MSESSASNPNRPVLRGLLAGAALCWTMAVPAELPAAHAAEDLIRAMDEATRHLNYDGVFVYQRGAQIDSMRLVHKFDGEREMERLISLSGPAREVIRDGTLVTCLFADDQAAVVEKNPPRDIVGIGFNAPLDKLLTNYGFSIDGSDRVAGRPATVVHVAPRADDRYGYRLWIDDASHLLLKSVILGQGGEFLEQVQFTHVRILDEVPAALLHPELGGGGFTWRLDSEGDADTDAPASEMPWSVRWLPSGFELKESNIQSMATSDMPVSHLVFSDGVAMVSVFVEQMTADGQALQGYSSRGAVNAFSRVAGGHQITVVGEVPLPTVRRIAASVAKFEN